MEFLPLGTLASVHELLRPHLGVTGVEVEGLGQPGEQVRQDLPAAQRVLLVILNLGQELVDMPSCTLDLLALGVEQQH